jgi:hypothetical protein
MLLLRRSNMRRVAQIILFALCALSFTCGAASESLRNETGKVASGVVIRFSESARIASWESPVFPVCSPNSGRAGSFAFSGGELPPGGRFQVSWTPSGSTIVAVEWEVVGGADLADGFPRILFDEAHDELNTLSEERACLIDNTHPEWRLFGALATTVSIYYTLERGLAPLEASCLDRFDVVIISTPRDPFAQQELETLRAFVAGGGGLLVLQDARPDPLVGSNQVAGLFGATFLQGSMQSTHGDWDGGSFHVDKSRTEYPIWPSSEGFQMNWGCAIAAPSGCEVLLLSRSDTWQDSDGDGWREPGEPAGPLPVAVALEIGSGRVILVGDNAFHNNIWSRNSRFFLNAICWLARR